MCSGVSSLVLGEPLGMSPAPVSSSSNASRSMTHTVEIGLGALVDGVGGVPVGMGGPPLQRAGVATGVPVGTETTFSSSSAQIPEKWSVVPLMKILSANGAWMSCFVNAVSRQSAS